MTPQEFSRESKRVVAFCDKYTAPEFPFTYRPGARRTVQFGLDSLQGEFRIHLGVDAGRNSAGGYSVYCPFDISRCEYRRPCLNFGSLLRLWVQDADFEIRIAHMDDAELSEATKRSIAQSSGLTAGAEIGQAGNLGKSHGKHTHTEIVSIDERSLIIEYVLLAIKGQQIYDPYTDADFRAFYERHFGDSMSYSAFDEKVRKELDRRSIAFLNGYMARRKDYLNASRSRTWYSSHIAFNGM